MGPEMSEVMRTMPKKSLPPHHLCHYLTDGNDNSLQTRYPDPNTGPSAGDTNGVPATWKNRPAGQKV
jgi:hypothetical protein